MSHYVKLGLTAAYRQGQADGWRQACLTAEADVVGLLAALPLPRLKALAQQDSGEVTPATQALAAQRYALGTRAGARRALHRLRQRWAEVWIARVGTPGQPGFAWAAFDQQDYPGPAGRAPQALAKQAAQQWVDAQTGPELSAVPWQVARLVQLADRRWTNGQRIYRAACLRCAPAAEWPAEPGESVGEASGRTEGDTHAR